MDGCGIPVGYDQDRFCDSEQEAEKAAAHATQIFREVLNDSEQGLNEKQGTEHGIIMKKLDSVMESLNGLSQRLVNIEDWIRRMG